MATFAISGRRRSRPKFLLAIGIACIGGATACAYLALPQLPETLAADKSVIDLGEVGQGKTVSGEFKLTNYHRVEARITGHMESCGCSDVKLSAVNLAPGQSTGLTATWKTGTNRGPSHVNIHVFYETDNRAYFRDLTLQGTVKPDIEYRPTKPAFSRVIASQRLDFTPGKKGQFTLKKVQCSHRAFIAKLEEQSVIVQFDASKWDNADRLEPYLVVWCDSDKEPMMRIYLDVDSEHIASEKGDRP
jgi:hypothetical protein